MNVFMQLQSLARSLMVTTKIEALQRKLSHVTCNYIPCGSRLPLLLCLTVHDIAKSQAGVNYDDIK